MEDIFYRLKQLEEAEAALLVERQAIIQKRAIEDQQIQQRREEEDRQFTKVLEDHDLEEDELRKKRRQLSRSTPATHTNVPTTPAETSFYSFTGPRYPTTTKKSTRKSKRRPVQKDGDRPVCYDYQGRALFLRQSDGNLVHLRCYVDGCPRTDFGSVTSLRNHVSRPEHKHKIEGVFKDNEHALDLCGVIFHGQETEEPKSERLPTPGLTDFEGPSSGGRSARGDQISNITASEGVWDMNKQLPGVSDLGRNYRTGPTTQENNTEIRSRAEQANEAFAGYLSDVSDAEGEDHQKESASGLEEEKDAQAEDHSSRIVPDNADPAVKQEHSEDQLD